MAQTTRSAAERTVPPGLKRARVVGDLLDDAIRVPGTPFRVGLDPLVGIVPFLGDGVASVASLYIVFVGFRLGVPPRTLAKMLGYVAVDFFLGSVPVLGVLIDAVLKVNQRNVAIVESHALDDAS